MFADICRNLIPMSDVVEETSICFKSVEPICEVRPASKLYFCREAAVLSSPAGLSDELFLDNDGAFFYALTFQSL